MLSLHAAVFSCLHKTWLVSFEKKKQKNNKQISNSVKFASPKEKAS